MSEVSEQVFFGILGPYHFSNIYVILQSQTEYAKIEQRQKEIIISCIKL